MSSTSASAYATLLHCARELLQTSGASALDQKLTESLRSAVLACEQEEGPPGRHYGIPLFDGLYWYHSHDGDPEPVLIDQNRYGERFKCFNGREQSWTRNGEFFTGPVPKPSDF